MPLGDRQRPEITRNAHPRPVQPCDGHEDSPRGSRRRHRARDDRLISANKPDPTASTLGGAAWGRGRPLSGQGRSIEIFGRGFAVGRGLLARLGRAGRLARLLEEESVDDVVERIDQV